MQRRNQAKDEDYGIGLLLAGVDEAGRGPLAGPVISAAVILKEPISGVRDSKLLSPKKRTEYADYIQKHALCFAYGRAEVEEIDAMNIHHATLLSMRRAVEGLGITPHEIWVDGLFVPSVAMPATPIVKGDQKIPAISAASILAKVYRDAEMEELDRLYPGYGFAQHKGYPTKHHKEQLRILGLSPVHRKSFKF